MKRRMVGAVQGVLVGLAIAMTSGQMALADAVPVVEVGPNLEANAQTSWQEWMSYIEHEANRAQTYVMMLKAMYEADYFSFITMFLDEFGEYFGDADVGAWKADIAQARDLYQGWSASYSQAQSLMEDIFDGDSDDVLTDMSDAIEFLGATSTRAIKEIGTLRSKRDARQQKARDILNKANGEVGQDRLLQMSVTAQANVLKGQNDIILALTTLEEMQSVMLQLQKQAAYNEELTKQWESGGLEKLGEAEMQTQPAFVEALP